MAGEQFIDYENDAVFPVFHIKLPDWVPGLGGKTVVIDRNRYSYRLELECNTIQKRAADLAQTDTDAAYDLVVGFLERIWMRCGDEPVTREQLGHLPSRYIVDFLDYGVRQTRIARSESPTSDPTPSAGSPEEPKKPAAAERKRQPAMAR